MGIIRQGVLGGISGKIGNIVGASWKGINYLRIKPASVANPRTPLQVNQRNKFQAVLEFLQPNLGFLKVGSLQVPGETLGNLLIFKGFLFLKIDICNKIVYYP